MHVGAPLMVANLLVRHNWVVGAKSPWGSWTPAEMGLRAELCMCASVHVCVGVLLVRSKHFQPWCYATRIIACLPLLCLCRLNIFWGLPLLIMALIACACACACVQALGRCLYANETVWEDKEIFKAGCWLSNFTPPKHCIVQPQWKAYDPPHCEGRVKRKASLIGQ